MNTVSVDVSKPLDCGHVIPERDLGIGGYAHFVGDGVMKSICYDCAADLDRAAAREHKPIAGYLTRSSPRHAVTTFAGRVLGLCSSVREYDAKGFGGKYKMVSVKVEIEGVKYCGRGPGYGMYVRLRPYKH